MQYRTLGASGLQVSPICLGTMTFGTPVSEPDAIKLVHGAIDLGVNFIDTANSYEGYARIPGSPGGLGEQITGKAIGDKREKVILATKVGSPLGLGPMDKGLSATHVHRELDNSLRRLQTDYIDLYIIHWPDKLVPLETTLSAMEVAVRQGKIRHFGVSNHTAWQICRLLWLAEQQGGPKVIASQVPFSLLRRDFTNDLDFCRQFNVAVTPYQSLQGGLLAGKYRRDQKPPTGSRGADKPQWMWPMDDKLYDKLEAIETLANHTGVPVSQYVLAWTLAQPAMTSLVVGATRLEQIKNAMSAIDVTVPDEHFAKIDSVFPPPWQQGDPIRD
ncbi:MAG: hypothetical protein CMJ20_01220 [Phycisphaeraceae bacterium]|nr:hypothetical protein [Phycisphaeraceae bacterium]